MQVGWQPRESDHVGATRAFMDAGSESLEKG